MRRWLSASKAATSTTMAGGRPFWPASTRSKPTWRRWRWWMLSWERTWGRRLRSSPSAAQQSSDIAFSHKGAWAVRPGAEGAVVGAAAAMSEFLAAMNALGVDSEPAAVDTLAAKAMSGSFDVWRQAVDVLDAQI